MAISLQVQNISKKFNEELFKDVNISTSGSVKIGLIGDNGSGKSTLLKILALQELPSTGKVVWSPGVKIGTLEQEIENDTFLVSGGEKKILRISELFYSDYNVLLLDEPDNHLDLEHKEWFENLVRDYDGLLIVISHDRHFLEHAVDHIWHLEEQRVTTYKFNYQKFKDIYEETMTSRKKLWETQEKERLRLKDFVERMGVLAASNDKFSGRLHNAEKRYERWVDEMVEKPPENKTAQIETNVRVDNTKKTALYLQHLCKHYDLLSVLNNLEMHVFCGEKVSISAPNGSGKSTLLNIIAGRLQYNSGSITIGPGLRFGYYAQEHLDALDPEEIVLVELQKSHPFYHYDGVAYLRRFLFTENQILSPVKFLSGGQKTRLQLAKFLSKNPDILVLDEPTNHLDLRTVLALEQFLQSYQGTLILVSHDRELVEKVSNTRYILQNGQLLREKT